MKIGREEDDKRVIHRVGEVYTFDGKFYIVAEVNDKYYQVNLSTGRALEEYYSLEEMSNENYNDVHYPNARLITE